MIQSPFAHFSIMAAAVFLLNGCGDFNRKQSTSEGTDKLAMAGNANDIIPFFEHWNLILGDGSNVGQAIGYENKDFFFTASDNEGEWVVFKSPNAGTTHGTSNNTRTELAQLKKWSPMTENRMDATLKVMNVSTTGDARVAATYSVPATALRILFLRRT